jgi:hypothetical protein
MPEDITRYIRADAKISAYGTPETAATHGTARNRRGATLLSDNVPRRAEFFALPLASRLKSQHFGVRFHGLKHDLNMFVECNAEIFSGMCDFVPVNRRCERFVFPFLLDRLQFDVGQLLGRSDQRHGNDESSQFIDGVESFLQLCFRSATGYLRRVGKNALHNGFIDLAFPQDPGSDGGVAFHGDVRVPFIIEIVQQTYNAPQILIFGKSSRVRPHRAFNREHMPPKRVALSVFSNQLPSRVSSRDHGNVKSER